MKDDTVLVVDDDPDIRELMRVVLESAGYHVKVAADGLDALTQLGAGLRPAVILLDLMMPRMDGGQFLKQMQSTGLNAPVIILSGDVSARSKADEFHVEECLMKPVEFKHLLESVKRFARTSAGI